MWVLKGNPEVHKFSDLQKAEAVAVLNFSNRLSSYNVLCLFSLKSHPPKYFGWYRLRSSNLRRGFATSLQDGFAADG